MHWQTGVSEFLHMVWCSLVDGPNVTFSASTWMPFGCDLGSSVAGYDIWNLFLEYSPDIDDSISLPASLQRIQLEVLQLFPIVHKTHSSDFSYIRSLDHFNTLDVSFLNRTPQLAAVFQLALYETFPEGKHQ